MDDTNKPFVIHGATTAEQLYQHALQCLALEQLEETRRVLELLVTKFPNHAHAHNDLGALWFQEGQLDRAREHLERARTLNPSDADIRNNLAEVYKACGDVEKAEEILRPANARASYLTIIALCSADPVEREHGFRSLAQQLNGVRASVSVILLRSPGAAPLVLPEYANKWREEVVAAGDLPKTILKVMEANPSELFAVLRDGYTLATHSLEQAITLFEQDKTLAAVASSAGEPGPEEMQTIANHSLRTFREHRAGLLVVRRSMFNLCQPCMEENLHTLDWMLKSALAAFGVLNLGVKTDTRIIAWPLRTTAVTPEQEHFNWHVGLTRSLLQLTKALMDPHGLAVNN